MIAAEPVYDFGEAAAPLLGEAPMVRGREAFFTCPFCGKPQRKRKFSINVNTGLWCCWSCDERGSYRILTARLGQQGEAPSPRSRPRAEADPPPALASPEARDRAYSTLLAALALDERHRGDLLIRGFSDTEIEAGGYRTLPQIGRQQIGAQVEATLGETTMDSVPGFYRSGGHSALSGPACSSLLIPVRDEQGLVVGIQARPDAQRSGGKYRWLSSVGLPGGTPARAELHFAWPTGRPDRSLRTAWITEGPLKAQALACRLGVLAVAVPGVGLCRTTVLVHRLRELGIESVVLAYDADAATKLPVARATDEMADGLLLNGSEVSIATWDLAWAKGVDDLLLLTQEVPCLVNLRDWREGLPESVRTKLPRHRGAVDIPAEEMPPPAPLEPMVSLSDARSQLGERIFAALRRPYARSTDVFADPPGTGKTAAWLDRIIALRRDGQWPLVDHWLTDDWGIRRKVTVPMRVVALFPNRQAMQEAYDSRPELAELVCLQEGRTPNPDNLWHCANFEAAQQLGARHHSVRLEVCPDCPFFEGCPYLTSLERARNADVVFAVHQSFLNAADELGADWEGDRKPAHTVIVEEEFLPELVEQVPLSLGCLAEWSEGIRRRPEMAQAGQLVDVLCQALAHVPDCPNGDPVAALPLMIEAARAVGVDLNGLVKAVDSARDPEDRRYTLWPFEKPSVRQISGSTESVVPLRAFSDLVKILREEFADPQRLERETRLWLGSQRSPSGRREPTLLLEVPRRQVIGHLRRATVINLNATPNRSLFELVFPRVRFHESQVASPMIITQVDNSLYARAYLQQRDGKALSTLQSAVDGIASRHQRVAVFCPKALDPGAGERRFVPPPGGQVTWGHFGAQTRSLNSYSGCGAVVVAGHHMWRPFQAEALVQALRWSSRRRKFAAGPGTSRRRPYVFRRPDGSGCGGVVHCHGDPLVQAALDWSTEAEIIQALGRARTVNRPEGQPVHAYLLTAAVTGLQIDRLLSMKDLLVDLGRPMAGPATDRGGPLCAANAARHADARDRVWKAARELAGEQRPVSYSAIAHRAKSDRRTVRGVLEGVHAGEEAVSIKISMDDGLLTRPVHPESSSIHQANTDRHQAADARIRRAAAELSAAGLTVTTSAVIAMVGGSRSTVGRVLAAIRTEQATPEHMERDRRTSVTPQPEVTAESDQPAASKAGPPPRSAASRAQNLGIRGARRLGWLLVSDPFTGDSCEVPARESPDWVWQAARGTRRGARAS